MAATRHNTNCSEIKNKSKRVLSRAETIFKKEKHGPYFEVSAIQASSVTLT